MNYLETMTLKKIIIFGKSTLIPDLIYHYCISALLEKEVFPQYGQLAENFGDWYKMAQNIHLKTEILISDVKKYELKLSDFEEEFAIDNSDYKERIRNNLDKVKKNRAPKKTNMQNQKLKMCLKTYKTEAENIREVLSDNNQIFDKLNQAIQGLEIQYSDENAS